MIIYVSESLGSKKNGGSSTSGFEFLQILRSKYRNVVVITNDPLTVDPSVRQFYGHDLHPVRSIELVKRTYILFPLTVKKILKKIYYAVKDAGKHSVIDLDRYFEEGEENILYVNSWSGIYEHHLRWTKKFKTVCIVRGSPESFVWQSVESDKQEAVRNAAAYLERFDHLIYVSSNGLADWSKILTRPINSFYLPNSINELEVAETKMIPLAEAKRRVGFNENDVNIAVIGSLQRRKGQGLVLGIMEKLVAVAPNIRFHFVGVISDTWGGDTIHQELTSSAYAKHFVFYGHSDNPILYMHAADILLFTSMAEAFPRTVAEYMAVGKPIVASDVSGVNEMIKHKENGLLYDPNRPEELLDGIVYFLRHPEVHRSFSEAAMNSYFTTFAKRNQIEKAKTIFSEIDRAAQ